MNLTDVIYWGWYKILDKTIYMQGHSEDDIGPREHSFFVTFLLHGINIWTILSYLSIEYFYKDMNLYLSLLIGVVIFVIGYLIYFKRKRADRVIHWDVTTGKGVLFVLIALIYAVVSVYLMLKVGDHIRYMLLQLNGH